MGRGSLVEWRRLCRGRRRVPDTLEGSADRTAWPGLLLEKAEEAMQARSDSETQWADRAEEFIRAPNPPEEGDVEVPTEVDESVIAGMRKGESAGGDGLTAETAQAWPDSVKTRLVGSFATLINNRETKWPQAWRECRVALIPKNALWVGFKELRPTTMLAVTQKVFAKVLLRFLGPSIALREEWTVGFRAGYQPSELTRTIVSLVGASKEWRRPLHIMKTGLTKAYDRASVEVLMRSFDRCGAPTRLSKAFLRMMMERSVRFAAPGIDETRPTRLRKGLAQGRPVSPLLFTMVLEIVMGPLVRRWQDQGIGLVIGSTHTGAALCRRPVSVGQEHSGDGAHDSRTRAGLGYLWLSAAASEMRLFRNDARNRR